MTDLLTRLKSAEAEVAAIKRQIAGASCAEVGHTWKHIGGMNAGCGLYCSCSVPVHSCKCGDSDYGENTEAAEIRAECAALRAREKGEG